MKKNIPLSESELTTLSQKLEKIIRDTGAFLAATSISQVTCKGGNANFVTDLDVTIQNMLVKEIEPLIPEAVFLLEESDEVPEMADYTWIIDPIDGTKNLINHYKESAISVGLVFRNTGVIGMVYNPFREEFFSAVIGNGAFLNGEPIHVSDTGLNTAIVCLGTSSYHPQFHQRTARCMGELYRVCGDFRRAGSAALELCYLACGRVDAFIEYKLYAWDFAAAATIIREAGGIIESVELPEWDFRKASGIVAAAPTLFDGFQKVVRNVQ